MPILLTATSDLDPAGAGDSPRPARYARLAARVLACGALLGLLACQETVEGVKTDGARHRAEVSERAAETRQALDDELRRFRAEIDEKLSRLESSLQRLEGGARERAEHSKEATEREIEAARERLKRLSASSKEELARTKKEVRDEVGQLGEKIGAALKSASESVEEVMPH